MPRIIVKAGYMKSGKHRSTYTKYIATRDGVELHTASYAHLDSTKKQNELIQDLIHDFPSSKELIEYSDYIENPCRGNASELIKTIFDTNLEAVLQRDNYVEYIAKRPRVEKLGEHGLFSMADNSIDLNQVADEVKEHAGIVWTMIVSIKREDATRLGYDCAENWKQCCRSKAIEMANSLRINPNNLKWFGAFHNESHHPHIHMILYSTNPHEGYLTNTGIEQIRVSLGNTIFNQDLIQLYQGQTEVRDEIKRYSKEIVMEIMDQLRNNPTDIDEELLPLIGKLKSGLNHHKGKFNYAYLSKENKQLVNQIVDRLQSNSQIQELFEQWKLYKQDIQTTYSSKQFEIMSLSQLEEFRSIRNMILQEVKSFDELKYTPIFTNDMMEFMEYVEIPDSIEEIECTYLKWTDNYKKGCNSFYGSKDIKKALVTFKADKGNVLTMEMIAKIYKKLGEPEKEEPLYPSIIHGYKNILKQHSSDFERSYCHYKLGKMAFYGLGMEKNYEDAVAHFFLSGSSYAYYSLGLMAQQGLGMEQSDHLAFDYFRRSSNSKNAYAYYQLAQCYEFGKGTDENKELANHAYQSAYHLFTQMIEENRDENLLYRLGAMTYDGQGCEKDIDLAIQYLKEAIDYKNENAKQKLAKIYLELDDIDHFDEAVKWLSESNNANSLYYLAKEVLSGERLDVNEEQAIDLLKQASNLGHAWSSYKLGKIYSEGERKDIEKAINQYEKSNCLGNEFASVQLGLIYLSGTDIPKDIDLAIHYLESAHQKNNAFAQFQLGKLFLLGKEVQQDKELGIFYLKESARNGNEFAQTFLDHLNDLPRANLIYLATRFLHQTTKIFEQQFHLNRFNALGSMDKKMLQKMKMKKQSLGQKME
ncbi:MobP3 family relaxase [Anaerorhabdus sp.]|uniref:MobP3 family relaxase n=3 Tax=Anaerorhabdus sp. TaxID=1872524 RepID=UPI002FC7D583